MPQAIERHMHVLALCAVVLQQSAGSAHAGLPAITVCDAIADAGLLDNTLVTIAGEVHSSFEVFALVDPACPTDGRSGGMIWLELPEQGEDDDACYESAPEGTAEDFVGAMHADMLTAYLASLLWVEGRYRVPVDCEPGVTWALLNERLADTGRATAVIVGRLDYAPFGPLRPVRGSNGSIGLGKSGGFGHLNSHSRRLVVARIVDVLPQNPPQ